MSRQADEQASVLVRCAWCGHTEDHETAKDRWALSFPGAEWCCGECFHDEDRGDMRYPEDFGGAA